MKKLITSFIASLLCMSVIVGANPTQQFNIGVQAGPGNSAPEVQLLETRIFEYLGGPTITRTGNYAFQGEVLYYKVRVIDNNGASDIKSVKLLAGGNEKSLCSYIDGTATATSKDYECMFTVDDSHGNTLIDVRAWDYAGAQGTISGGGTNWFLNPIISVDISTTTPPDYLYFPSGEPGSTVLSSNALTVTNNCEDGVTIRVYMSGTDMYGDDTAMCPDSNVLSVDNLEYYVHNGAVTWTQMRRYDDNKPFGNGRNIGTLSHGASMQIDFRLTYPMPCIGTFTNGNIYFVVEAI